ncbi:MAG: aminopeptidase P family protein, partial [Deltaproteobacteria bacterium]|nr:aminopeptidase P family protein [Deltaproteobacteria bacterium]
EIARPGISINALYETSVARAKSLGYAETYLGPPGYKVSFVGHGIGLDLVEQPIIGPKNHDPLQPGMTFAIEPKINFIDAFGVGIESVFTVTETGCRIISRVPKKIFIT